MSSFSNSVRALSPTTRLRSVPEAVSTPVGADQTVVLHLTRQVYYELNATATRLWALFSDERSLSVDELVDQVASEPGTPNRADVARDVETFVHDLLHAGLLERRKT
jgi:hypothetical protein